MSSLVSAGSAGGVPVLILREGTTRTRGKDAQGNNIAAAKAISEIVKSSLGPRGMDKMLVDSMGDVTITNDGATILKEMDVEHPAAKMMVEIAKTTDTEVGDGTTSVVVLAGELLKRAEGLLDKGIHPSIIVDGYKKAADQALKIYSDMAITTSPTDKEMLRKVARTSMATKMVTENKELLADLTVQTILDVAQKVGDKYTVSLDDIKVDKKVGASLDDTKRIDGIILDKEIVHSGMPKKIENAKIALISSALEIEKTEFSAEIRIKDPLQMKAFMDEEEKILSNMVDNIAKSGANVVICQKGIDDTVQYLLAKRGISAVRRAKESDMEKLAKATGGRITNSLKDLKAADLGKAKLVEERKVGEDKWTFIEGCTNPHAVTILIRGGTEKLIDEAERSVHDALSVVKDVVMKPKVVAGGGAPETEASAKLRRWAEKLGGREQLAAIAFAESMEVIPITLAENAGLDPIDIIVDLRARHEKGEKWYGVNVLEGKATDMAKLEVYEPLVVKEQIVKAASEAATMILRVDDVIAGGKKSGGPPMPPGGMGGMGGME